MFLFIKYLWTEPAQLSLHLGPTLFLEFLAHKPWQCQAKQNYISTALVPDVVVACCVLHNIPEINKEHYLPEWNTEQPELPEPEQVAHQGVQAHSHQAICEAIMSIL